MDNSELMMRWPQELPPEWMVRALDHTMEGSSEPQMDAKSKGHQPTRRFSGSWVWLWAQTAADHFKYPHVTVMLKVADHLGQAKNKSFEMTIPQCQDFYRQFKEIAAIFETVWKLITWLMNCYHHSKIMDFTFCNKTA